MYKLQISAFISIPFHFVSVLQFFDVYEEWLEMIYCGDQHYACFRLALTEPRALL